MYRSRRKVYLAPGLYRSEADMKIVCPGCWKDHKDFEEASACLTSSIRTTWARIEFGRVLNDRELMQMYAMDAYLQYKANQRRRHSDYFETNEAGNVRYSGDFDPGQWMGSLREEERQGDVGRLGWSAASLI